MTATPPEIIESHLSPDGKSRAEIVRYDCVNKGEVEQVAYELLRLAHLADGVETTVADQLQYCGGLGAYGLGFVYWSSDGRYLYYTDTAQGIPDGHGLGWYRSLFRYDLLNGETIALRWGPMAPDGITMAYADPRELALYIWDMDKGEAARIPSFFTAGSYGPAIYGLAWSPDGKSLVYAETNNAYESTDTKSWIVFLNLATFDRQVIYQSDNGTLYCCQWQASGQIQFQLDDQAFQYLDVPQVAPGTEKPTSLWCKRPDDLQATKVAISSLPGAPQSFCIVWAESATLASGYRVELKYDGSGDVFGYSAGPYGTQWIVPLEYQPRLDESQEQFIRRHSYSVNVYELSAQGKTLLGTTSVEIDNPDFLSLPTETITP